MQRESAPVQMMEHYLMITPPLRLPVLDWLTTHITALPTKEQVLTFQGHTTPVVTAGDFFDKIYRRVAMDFVQSCVPSFNEGHVNGNSITAETYRELRDMILGLSQEDVLVGLNMLYPQTKHQDK